MAKTWIVYKDWPRQSARKRACTVRVAPRGGIPVSAMVGEWREVVAASARAAKRKSGLVCK